MSCTNQSCNNRYSKYCVGMGNTTIVTFYQLVIIASGVIMGVPWPDGHSILGRHHRTAGGIPDLEEIFDLLQHFIK